MPTRTERVRALWSAMSPGARERAWAALRDEQRADALALLLGAVDEEAPLDR